jgi:hypothetical protein
MAIKKTDYKLYKKILLVFIIIFFLSIFLIKFLINSLKTELQFLVTSNRAEIFISEQIKKKIEAFANKEISNDEYLFYKENFRKIYIKFKPIFDDIQIEENKKSK